MVFKLIERIFFTHFNDFVKEVRKKSVTSWFLKNLAFGLPLPQFNMISGLDYYVFCQILRAFLL